MKAGVSTLLLAAALGSSHAFAPQPAAVVVAPTNAASLVGGASAQLQNGIDVWSASSSSVVLSDIDEEASKIAAMAAKNKAANEAARAKEEARKKSTEQLAGEKKTFAWYFWGGGFVAPFLATFYYFGFKFWEK